MSSPIETAQAPPLRAGWSLRLELLLSHAGLVALVVLGFGCALFAMMIWATLRQAEADLLGAAQMLVQSLDAPGKTSTLAISETYRDRFGKAPRDHAYFAVWDAAGKQLAATDPLPAHARPSEKPIPQHGPHPFFTRVHGWSLDVLVATPQGGQLLIGRPLAKEFDGLVRLFFSLLFVGLTSLAMGVWGARWLANRIAAPIERMATTAEQISSRNLTQRLEMNGAPQEISRLAQTFNTMLAGLQQSFERQLRFTADASHELRTPVAVVLSQAEHTLARERSGAEYRDAMETCLRASQRMKHLVDDLLLLARADAGRLELRREPVDLSTLAKQVVSLLQPLAQERSVTLQTHLQPAVVSGDSTRLGQVLTNLVTNAVQYNVPQGTVLINVLATPDGAVLEVKDQGVGIAPEDQPHLFDRFFRVDHARTQHEQTGTGLGLSLVAEIVAAHQGTITVHSTPGVGTTMTVRLPLASA